MLTDTELDAMRETAENALPEQAVLYSGGGSSDGAGGWTDSWTNAGTVDCRVAPLSGTEREMGDRIAADAEFVITLPHDAPVTTDSQIRVVGGGTFNVEAIRDRSYEVTTRVEAVKQV